MSLRTLFCAAKKTNLWQRKASIPNVREDKKMAKLELMAVVGFAGCVEAEQLWKETPPPKPLVTSANCAAGQCSVQNLTRNADMSRVTRI